MKIKFYGNSCFSITESGFSAVTDPHSKLSASLKASVVTVSQSNPEHSNSAAVGGEPRVFNWPGEYEVGGIHIVGIASFHNPKEDKKQDENTIFTFDVNGIHICHLGGLGTKLIPEQLEQIGDVDVLFIPVGGNDVIDAKKAKEVIEQIEPRVIIPMAYSQDGDDGSLGGLSPFLQSMGAQALEPLIEFDVKRSDLPEESSKVVVLKQQ